MGLCVSLQVAGSGSAITAPAMLAGKWLLARVRLGVLSEPGSIRSTKPTAFLLTSKRLVTHVHLRVDLEAASF
jgi:hypothetical protein